MSELSGAQRLQLLAALVDGNSERAAWRMTDISRNTIKRFALRMGHAAQSLHNTLAHDLSCSLIEVDEIWSYVRKKDARASDEEKAAGLGEAYTYVALGMPSRFVIAYHVGRRGEVDASAFMTDLRARLVTMPAITSDGLAAYVPAIGASFGPGVDYGQTIKNYRKGGRKDDDHRYEPPREPFLTKKTIFGAPDMGRATTAHVERNNGTMRHFIGRMRRLVYAFSKKPENHRAAVSLAYVHYNLCHILRTTRVTPALAVGATNHLWELPELLDALLSVPETDTPGAKPLAPRVPEGAARELPGGRGFLRLVPPSGSAPAAPPPPPPPPAAPAVTASSGALVLPAAPPTDDRQLDLLAWKPKAPPAPAAPEPPARPKAKRLDATPEQLGLLFGIDLDPEPKK